MATSELVRPKTILSGDVAAAPARDAHGILHQSLSALASLRLTVVLFAFSIALVFLGTLAQVDHDVWDVVYHRCFCVWFAQIEWQSLTRLVQIFFPVQWNLTGAFPFPGGKLIGSLLFINLLAAHAVRFKVAASGPRLHIGLGLIALGLAVTALVIRSGLNNTIESELSPAFCFGVWQAFRAGLAALVLAGIYLLMSTSAQHERIEWWLLLGLVVIVGVATGYLFLNADARPDDSGLRILWQLAKGFGAGGVLLAGCVLVFEKRAGIVLLHAGIGLMMGSQLWTAISANEAQMAINEGESASYASDIRSTELAVIDRSATDHDRVTVIPASLLAANVGAAERLDDSDLPFTIQVLRWLPNAKLAEAKSGERNPATAGFGPRLIAEELPQVTGIDKDNRVDRPVMYVELFSKPDGKSLGTYLMAEGLREQTVDVGGHEYQVALRFVRSYYPYSLALKKFRFDRYMGTNTAKNFSSELQLTDPTKNVDRAVKISMNNPLRYAGNTFYQADWNKETERGTILQVVRNPGWMAPYVACMLVFVGMIAHFGTVLARFVDRRSRQPDRVQLTPIGVSKWRWLVRVYWFPALIVALAAMYIGTKARLPHAKPGDAQIYEFAKLPLSYQGRIKPYDSLAQNALQIISGRQELRTSAEDRNPQPAIRWLLDVISDADAARDDRVFRIENLELLETLGLKPREQFWRYSLNEFRDKIGELERQINLARDLPKEKLSEYQRAVLLLGSKLNLYVTIVQSFRSPELATDREQLTTSLQQVQQEIERLRASEAPQAVPPKEAGNHWMPLMEAEFELLHDKVTNQPVNPATVALSTMLDAYRRGDVTTFNREIANYRSVLADYQKSLDAKAAELKAARMVRSEILSQGKVNFEVFFNHFSPFYYAMILYIFAFLLGSLSWLGWTEPLRKAANWLLMFTFILHTFALAARIFISGRPPITNLYSTAIFIGWACVLMALVIEALYRNGFGNIAAAVIGFLTLLVAHFLSLDGDTLIVLQAVLDTQFWLATHVITINMGYATTYLAGAIGIMYLLFGHIIPMLDEEVRRELLRMMYGTLCFAIFFSFVGTVLGGLWADDSWGRFWGWDPKENGALMLVLYNALVLHARWGGLVSGRGLSLLAIGGNIVTTWSYFGVNALGVGLHAYGGTEHSTAMWLLAFTLSQLALITLGALPREWFTTLWPSRQPTVAK